MTYYPQQLNRRKTMDIHWDVVTQKNRGKSWTPEVV